MLTTGSRYAGCGVGLRHEYFDEIIENGPQGVSWVEVISENFFDPGGRPWRALERVRRDLPVVIHGVSLGIGNADPIDQRYIDQLRRLIDRLEPAAVSDHLCWGAFGGHHAHDLLPLPLTEPVLDYLVDRVQHVQDLLGRRILLENVSSYLTYRQSVLTEHEFLGELARRADCDILLDVNNIVVSATNHGFDPGHYIDALPADRIGHIHLAGHTDKGDYLLDSHVGPVPPCVWQLYRQTIETIGPRPTMVEWDQDVPAFGVVVEQSQRALAITDQVMAARRRMCADG
ncbi:MAG: DUF692 domain-containing protein [Deltaproteobacteria bacterium]|nr:DUF692 domain-containing protein [Deltaproteobacteria bacterium]